uniref:Uncharacterized protein n=1 Tax=Setaria viridis TaxID=4556 RepID=A0A4U6VY13_SETVI|nr:hypothetical protein SEVIR_3G426050v2 [Setaria viridis]
MIFSRWIWWCLLCCVRGGAAGGHGRPPRRRLDGMVDVTAMSVLEMIGFAVEGSQPAA